ncbi:MAG: glutamate--tRNA ligase [Alphaproteobacteria bacterium]
MSIKVRFAPSPTGMMHIGNARTALITWLFTRAHNGHFLLRIDDTDQERSKEEYEKAIEEGLQWLGMDWDEKARQKNRMDIYNKKIESLKEQGRLYPCYETPDELELKRKTQLSRKQPPIYDREALSLTEEQKSVLEAQGRKPHWRFKLDHEPIEWDDIVRGAIKFSGADLSDPVLIREDASPLYHLCSVIDDIEYGITHVIRGEDHVSNTACHIQMFKALGANIPTFAHLPLLSDKEGGKLSKRHGSLSLKDLQNEGLEPMAVVSLMARLGSSEPVEPFTNMDEVIKNFDLSTFSRATPKFDSDELFRLNTKILQALTFEDIKTRLADTELNDMTEEFWLAIKPNIESLNDAHEWWAITNGTFTPHIDDKDFIQQAAELLPAAPWDENTWQEWIKAIKEQTGRKGKQLFTPLRLALTGKEHGPELRHLLLLIGENSVKERLQHARKAA